MSTEQFDEFNKRYKRPEVEELTVGYAGIDPPLKNDGTDLDHECLDGLLGGDDEGHYHLTKKQLEGLEELYEKDYFPRILRGQVIDAVPNDEITPYTVLGVNVKKGE